MVTDKSWQQGKHPTQQKFFDEGRVGLKISKESMELQAKKMSEFNSWQEQSLTNKFLIYLWYFIIEGLQKTWLKLKT